MATYQIRAPEQMNCSGDLPTNWKMFREAYEDYLVATGLDNKEKKIQVATLKTLMGTECKKILKCLQLTQAEMEDPKTILDTLQEQFVPARNILYERYIFHNTEQQAHETIEQYLIKLRRLAEPCQFGNLEDEMVRDRLVLGCTDSAARTRLYREKSCDLKKAVESLRISEATIEQLKKTEGNGMHEPVNCVDKEKKNLTGQRKEMEIPVAGNLRSAFTVVASMSTIKTSAQHLAKRAGSVVNPTIFSLCAYKSRVFTTCKKNRPQRMSQYTALNLLERWNTNIKSSFL